MCNEYGYGLYYLSSIMIKDAILPHATLCGKCVPENIWNNIKFYISVYQSDTTDVIEFYDYSLFVDYNEAYRLSFDGNPIDPNNIVNQFKLHKI